MAHEAEATNEMGEEEKRLKRKQSLESAVTLGMGGGKKKQRHVEAFHSAIWPVLTDAGWTLAKGEGDEEGATYFLPPGVTMDSSGKGDDSKDTDADVAGGEPKSPSKEKSATTVVRPEGPWECKACGHTNTAEKSRCTGTVGEGKCYAWRGGKRLRKPYLSRVRDVIERVLERKTDAEATAADAFLELVPNAFEVFVESKKDKAPSKRVAEEEPSSPSRDTRSADMYAWKEERTHYEKASSRVGSEYQVDVLPLAGSHTSAKSDAFDGGALYERVWDPQAAEKSGKLDFVHTRVKFNKKEAAIGLFHDRGYRLPGFYHEVSKVSSTDCGDWTKEEKDLFRSAVFEHHEDMREVSKMVGKPVSECITYYLVKFKKTKSYKSLKRSMKRKANVTEGSAGTLVCNECGNGGMLIACDTCEAHYHLGCATPPLQSIPDGSWHCGNCRRDTRSMLSSQDEMSCGTDQNNAAGASKESAAREGSNGTGAEEESGDAATTDATEEDRGQKRKRDAVAVTAQAETDSERSNEQPNESPGSKRIKITLRVSK
ncbi:hypothetical protein ACHAXT_011798 [Thalassiosira profunda]